MASGGISTSRCLMANRAALRGERVGDVLAQLVGVVVLAVLVEESLDGGERGMLRLASSARMASRSG